MSQAMAEPLSLPAASGLRIENPRAFGHFIGDVLPRQVDLSVPHPFVLAMPNTPRPTRVNAWMELTGISIRANSASSGTRYHVDLVYQIVNSPQEVITAMMPPVDLHFVAGGRSFDAAIDAWPIVIAPLATGTLRAGLEAVRPAHAPLRVEAGAIRIGLAATGLCTGAVLAALALARFGWPGIARRPRPFASAHRAMRSLAKLPASKVHRQAAFRAMHLAFDDTMGRRLFGEQIDEFIAKHPKFRNLGEEARGFYAASRSEFFGGGTATDPPDVKRLMALCAKFKSRE